MKPLALHGQLIADYIARNPGTETRRFAAAVRGVVADFEWGVPLEEYRPPTFIPDAFRIDRKAQAVIIVEAQVTSRITSSKWWAIQSLWWELDSEPWDLWLHLVDRSGAVFSVDMPTVAVLHCGSEAQCTEGNATCVAQPPGRYIWLPGNETALPDEWPDQVAPLVQKAWAEGRMPSLIDDERDEAAR